ncbi:MAG: 30S ribosomal protein S27e [Candidatus Caldarchaeum sp.]|uniref:Small ribosomal subunit protein eS27 n=1 Tax=Caldiarchaeum subterraneum TaxID=311458 RepID=A0A7C5QQA8_CALS0
MSEVWESLIPRPRSRFIQVVCNECGNKQIVFDSAKIEVRCNVCGTVLCKPSGGKAVIIAKKERVLE